jgi:O-antigen/teichoic acid export membrane protein
MVQSVNLQRIKDFFLKNQFTKQTVAKNTIWLGFGNIVSKAIRAILIIYAARILGAEGYGIFSYALNFVALFGIFSDIGISTVLTREYSKNQATINKFLSTSFFIKIALITISIIFVFLLGPALTKIPQVIPLLPLVAALLLFDNLRDFTFAITRAREKMELETAINITTNIAITVLGLVALMTFKNGSELLTAYTLGSAIGTALSFWLIRHDLREVFSSFDRSLVKSILIDAWPIGVSSLLGALMISTDTVMLGWFRDTVEVGLYSAAQRPVQFLYLLPTFLAAGLFPTMARLAHHENERFRNVFEQALKVTFLISLPITLGGFILSKNIMLLIFGSGFSDASLTFAILLITLISNSAASILIYAIFAYQEQGFMIKSLALGFFSNLALNFVFIPRYGGWGSALSTVIAHLLIHGSMWLKMKKVNPFAILPILKQAISSTAIMALITYLLQTAGVNIILNVIASATVYIVALILMKEPLLHKNFILSVFK